MLTDREMMENCEFRNAFICLKMKGLDVSFKEMSSLEFYRKHEFITLSKMDCLAIKWLNRFLKKKMASKPFYIVSMQEKKGFDAINAFGLFNVLPAEFAFPFSEM